ncbi:MAG: YvcK family protein [Candidatus Liptonbacteria bacterium]|nr:YvcK family protein [Candidatus Liptonbacteria bacterium]
MKRKNVVTIGGGTGNFTVLTALKKYPFNLNAIVSMADDGGSNAMLRDELGVLPPSDISQCLVALSASEKWMRELMNFKFPGGRLRGHRVGNLFLSALEIMSGSFDAAVERVSEILRIEGRVIPVTLEKVRLAAYLKNGTIIRGEDGMDEKIYAAGAANLKKISFQSRARANPKALQAIRHADFIVIGPGDVYTSLVPNFLVSGIPDAIRKSRAKKIYICNLMSKAGRAEKLGVADFVNTVESYLGAKFDYVVYNNSRPPPSLLEKYTRKGESLVRWHGVSDSDAYGKRYIGSDLINRTAPKQIKGDLLQKSRSLIRHDPLWLGKLLARVISSGRE